VIAQTRDVAIVAATLRAAGFPSVGLERPGVCLIVASRGDEVIGVVGVESVVDQAVTRVLYVNAPIRGRGIGAALVAAARSAAHTRGARTLYGFEPKTGGGFLARIGFVPAVLPEALDALAGTAIADYLAAEPDRFESVTAWKLDLSRDGIIER
jgi:N-acetylglutamate synthase-like GNAT family acetyltransferase